MKKHASQNGSASAIVIAVLVVGLIGALGFIFWQNFGGNKSDEQNKPADTTDSKVVTPEPEEERDPAEWTVYEGDGFSLPIPDGWKLHQSDIALFQDKAVGDSIAYKPGTDAVITKLKETAVGHVNTDFMIKTQLVEDIGDVCEKSSAFISESGVDVTKCYNEGPLSETGPESTLAADTKTYFYEFYVIANDNASRTQIQYTVKASETDNSSKIELGLKKLSRK